MTGGAVLTEYLDCSSASNSEWGDDDPSGLDKTNRQPATANAGTPVVCEPPDDNESQEWNLTSVGLAHPSNSITATVFVYRSAASQTVTFTAQLYTGSWGSSANLQWNSGQAGWQSAEIGSSLSTGDFSGAKLRLTSPTVSTPHEFEAIYVKLESDSSVDVYRQCDIFLTESGGTYYLNFDLHRYSDAADSDYYLEPDPAFGNQSHANAIAVGPGETYETIGDLEGTELTFTHNGSDNADTGEGTEDATVKITIENFSIGQ